MKKGGLNGIRQEDIEQRLIQLTQTPQRIGEFLITIANSVGTVLGCISNTISNEGRKEGGDEFMKNPPQQPKREIADYVEENGTLVPRRFQSFDEALAFVKEGGTILVRSEHSGEYAGASGLLDSHIIDNERISNRRRRDDLLKDLDTCGQEEFEERLKNRSQGKIKRYCELLGLDEASFTSGISYSYWERIDGLNSSIVADSAIPNRYHIMTRSPTELRFKSYIIIENGKIIFNPLNNITDADGEWLSEIIALYERIRNMEKFAPNHCPIIEIQTDEAKNNYFLQYHRTRDMEVANFTLDRDLEEDEVEASYVRGATPKDGLILNVTLHYPRKECELVEKEDASCGNIHDPIFEEIMARRRTANIKGRFPELIAFYSVSHEGASSLFNPQISLSISPDDIPEHLRKTMCWEPTDYSGVPPIIPMQVFSDGSTAYVRFL